MSHPGQERRLAGLEEWPGGQAMPCLLPACSSILNHWYPAWGGCWPKGTAEVGSRGLAFKRCFFPPFGNAAFCSHAVTVKIRFKLWGWLWLFPFLSEFLPTCNLLNEILLFRLTGIFFADVDLTQLYKICELCSFFPIFNSLRIRAQQHDRIFSVHRVVCLCHARAEV